MSYQFIKTKNLNNKFDNSEVIMTVDSEADLFDLLEEFQCFLKACGFGFNGIIDIVNDNE
jgi:hypothetical protein